jgi:hypothetical protein
VMPQFLPSGENVAIMPVQERNWRRFWEPLWETDNYRVTAWMHKWFHFLLRSFQGKFSLSDHISKSESWAPNFWMRLRLSSHCCMWGTDIIHKFENRKTGSNLRIDRGHINPGINRQKCPSVHYILKLTISVHDSANTAKAKQTAFRNALNGLETWDGKWGFAL